MPPAAMRVLVIEDEVLIAALMEDMLGELGATVVGPVATRAAALVAAQADDFDAALVDMNLRGEPADPVAQLLSQRGIPFALASGSSTNEAHGQVAVLKKPFAFNDVTAVLERLRQARQARSAS